MNSRRTGIVLLLAGMLIACLPFDLLARPRVPPPTAQPAPVDASLEAANREVHALEARVRELAEMQTRLLQQMDEQARLLEQVKQATGGTFTGFSAVPPMDALPLQPEAPTGFRFNWVLGSAAVFACALCIILLLRMRQPETGSAAHASGADAATVTATVTDPDTKTTLPPPVHPILPALPDWDPASPALDLQAVEVFAPEENIRAHDSTIELAEIMLSFGRVNSAAEALANFIENNPKDAITPWLKLLEVYRESGQHDEFDRIAQRLNRAFNARAVNWDNFDDARDPSRGIETMPHIVNLLQQIWGTRKCQAYLQYLLHDTRNETRRGFSLTAIDDILCLSAALEYDLGPYTGPMDEFYNPENGAPPTEIESLECQEPTEG
ncbi:MAG: hypothetical protein LBT71_10645 [Azoarcus sp.]|jgi:hypothetical protein|nr:hypothetical protein [Azoarcus sp.]